MPMRKAFTLLSGALALGWMGFCMLLALRPAWLERSLGGLDKLYHGHKWAGITSVLLVMAHWLLILSPRTLASWGWIETVARGRHGPGGGGSSLIGLAKEMGEWSAWIMIVLGVVALLRFVPYGWFRKLHKGFPVAFLIGATRQSVRAQLAELKAMGVRRLVALRGDLPSGYGMGGEFHYASDLVAFIRAGVGRFLLKTQRHDGWPVWRASISFRRWRIERISRAWMSMSVAWPCAPPSGWWIITREFGSA